VRDRHNAERQRDRLSRPRPRRRPLSPNAPLVGRQLWRVGDWGGASEQIGRRWEVLGSRALEQVIGVPRPGPGGAVYLPRRALVLSTDPELAAQIHSGGKPHADAILVGEADRRVVLEPVDFKWTLETANPKQVGAEVLEALLTDPPALLAERLAQVLADLPGREPVDFYDGIFLAPDHADNRAFLAPRGPLDPSWAHLCAVDPIEFFEPLIGWDVAYALARADGARLATVEGTERYYRLGAGVLGALGKLSAGTFADEPAAVDGPAALAQLRRERRLGRLGDLIAYLDRALIARNEMLERLREVERASYPFALFRQDLAARGVIVPMGRGDRRWQRLYGGIMRSLGDRLRAEGRRLVASGRTEAQALADLDAGRARWTAVARGLLADLNPQAPPDTGAAPDREGVESVG
jgi:hypothetical protein